MLVAAFGRLAIAQDVKEEDQGIQGSAKSEGGGSCQRSLIVSIRGLMPRKSCG